ncbi:hypothetical protein ANO11243_093190 [Dothideomycetidae sp. 11243]|nr:hypothetical protein ANO11243_093190 [fungal sp. No.11243]
MAAALGLQLNLLLWPASAYALTNGSCLLLAGSVADVVGTRHVNLVGCLLISIFILACGFAHNGSELIAFRALQGVAGALAVPTGMSIISNSVERGPRRNIGFAMLGLAQPLGYSFGLVLGGVFTDELGWRVGFYICAAGGFLLTVIGIWSLPKDAKNHSGATVWTRLAREVDWVGTVLLCAALSLFSYVLAMLSAQADSIKKSSSIAMLILSAVMIVGFAAWMNRQERLRKPALIPNSFWKKKAFTSICIMTVLVWAVINGMELFSSLFFQKVQSLSALQASIRLIPNVVVGIACNFFTGYFVAKVPAIYSVIGSCILGAVAPLLMAVNNPQWPYWYDAFFAQCLAPLAVDTLFTIGLLIVSDVFPRNTQALAGAVFNTLAQVGTSIGLCVMSVISNSVAEDSGYKDKTGPQALLEGYRATFWAQFAWSALAVGIGLFGLRKMDGFGGKHA